jgi:hypothetical protein
MYANNIPTSNRVVLTPDTPSLQGAELRAACAGQVGEYRTVVRSAVDESVPNQSHGLLSFMLFSEPKKTNRGKPVYGFVKLRGNWGEEIVRSKAQSIVKDQDSKYPVRIGPVGVWLPITEDDDFVKEQLDVRTSKEEIHLRDEAVHEAERERQRKLREIKEREEELKQGGDLYDEDKEFTIDFYTMKRVTELRLQENLEIFHNKMTDIEDKLEQTRNYLVKLESKNPSYREMWIDRYNEERRKVCIPDYIPNSKWEENLDKWRRKREDH